MGNLIVNCEQLRELLKDYESFLDPNTLDFRYKVNGLDCESVSESLLVDYLNNLFHISCLTVENIEDAICMKFIKKENKMTNKEYIEKNNISFSEAMKMYDNEKYPCINDWLNQEHKEHKFEVGDFVIIKGNNNGIGIVIDVKDRVYYKFIERSGVFRKFDVVGSGMYYKYDADVFYMTDESKYQKIF